MIFLISLGLYQKEDMSIKAVGTAKKCDKLYIERYTSYYKTTTKELEKFLGKKIREISREELEGGEKILREAKNKKIGIMIIGDALTATTHTALMLEAKKKGIKIGVIHGSSILTAVGETGLSLYKFGKTTSIPFANQTVQEPYNVIKNNKELHTLILLDLKPNENRYMRTQEAIDYLLRVEENRKEKIFTEETKIIIIAALGGEKEIKYGKAKEMNKINLKGIPQCLIVPGKLHFMEEEYLESLG
ncbi:MAG: diphthine synthase [archaeon]